MHVTPERHDKVYEHLRKEVLEEGSHVVVLVGMDVDAMCACRIFLYLLKNDFMSFHVVPVRGYDDLTRANEELLQGHDGQKSVVLINCGGIADVSELFSLTDDMTVYVVDSHRPYNLHNLFGSEQIIVLNENGLDKELHELEQAFGEDQADEKSEEENDVDENLDPMDDEEENEDMHLSDRENQPPQQKKSLSSKEHSNERTRRKKRIENRRKMADYYLGDWYGTASSIIMYNLAKTLGRETDDLLWLAIIGLTEQLVHEKIARDHYTKDVVNFTREVNRRMAIYQEESGEEEEEEEEEEKEEEKRRVANRRLHGKIKFEDEFRFMLFRHWSLYESMFHSNYVASKLGIWRDRGRKKLANFLAKMGLPLKECHQNYVDMNIVLKNSLRDQIEKFAPEYGLMDICYGSFYRQYSYTLQLSASDVVYGITALLEAPPEIALKLGAQVEWNTSPTENPLERSSFWLGNFYTAYDALDSNHVSILKSGLVLAMKLQRAIVEKGTSLIEKRAIITTRSLRFTVMTETLNLYLFTHPLTLSKLALFLVEALRETSRNNSPFVIAALNPLTDHYLVVGVTGGLRYGDNKKSHFGLAFRQAAEKTHSRVKHDSFETSVIEVKREDLTKFMETLQLNANDL